MNKFYILSAILHGIVIFSIVGFSKDEELKFKEKTTMMVSVKNRKAVSNTANISLEKEEKKEEKTEEKTEKKEDTLVEEKVMKKESIKKESTKKILEKKKSKDKNLNKKSKTIEKKEEYNEFKDQNRFLQGEDGIFTAVSLDGIEYEIKKEIDPQYPLKAKKIGYNGIGVVKVKFLVDLDGSIKNIEFISGENKFGFKEEVEKALKKWKFKPIIYRGKTIRVHFEKEFKFKRS